MNKLRILTLTFLIFSTTLLMGQSNKMELGIEAGPSLRSLHGNEIVNNYNLSLGFSGGLSFQYNFTKLLSARTGISFERKGTSDKVQVMDEFGMSRGKTTVYSNFDYMTIPLLARLTFGDKIHLFVNAGPYFGYLLQQKDKSDAIGEFPKQEIDNTDLFKRHDFGLTAGLGAYLPLQDKLVLSLELRNNYGLVNTSKHPVMNDGSIKTNSTNLLVGIAYKLGNKK